MHIDEWKKHFWITDVTHHERPKFNLRTMRRLYVAKSARLLSVMPPPPPPHFNQPHTQLKHLLYPKFTFVDCFPGCIFLGAWSSALLILHPSHGWPPPTVSLLLISPKEEAIGGQTFIFYRWSTPFLCFKSLWTALALKKIFLQYIISALLWSLWSKHMLSFFIREKCWHSRLKFPDKTQRASKWRNYMIFGEQ